MNPSQSSNRAVLVHSESVRSSPGEPYDLATAARLADLHPEKIRYYCRLGLVRDVDDPESGELFLTDHAVFELRRIEYLRRVEGVNLTGIRIILDLIRRTEHLDEALRFHQGP